MEDFLKNGKHNRLKTKIKLEWNVKRFKFINLKHPLDSSSLLLLLSVLNIERYKLQAVVENDSLFRTYTQTYNLPAVLVTQHFIMPIRWHLFTDFQFLLCFHQRNHYLARTLHIDSTTPREVDLTPNTFSAKKQAVKKKIAYSWPNSWAAVNGTG